MVIFITSVSCSENFRSFTNRFFYFLRSPGFRRAFDAAERNGILGRIQCQRGKESSRRGKRRVFLCRRTVRVEVIGKVILTGFLKVERRGMFVGVKDRRKRDG